MLPWEPPGGPQIVGCLPRWGHLLALVTIASILAQHTSAVDKGASVTLRAKWQGSPYMMEAAEMLAEDDEQLFWSFLESSVTAQQPEDASKCWAHVLSLTQPLLDPGVSKVAPLLLASRKHTAKAAMYQQLAQQLHPDEQACCFVDMAGQVVHTPDQLSAALQQLASRSSEGPQSSDNQGSSSTAAMEGDHVFKADVSQPGAPRVVLYAPVGAACTQPLHAALKAAASTGKLVYVLRPLLQDSCQASVQGSCVRYGGDERVVLPGWGVEAVLKNTEYSAMDDKERQQAASQTAAAGGAAQGTKGDGGQESLGSVKGFAFDTLVARKPALAQELLTFRDHLLSSDEEESVKVWEVKDVGLQATQRIIQASDPLSLFTELSQNFPSLVSSLSRQHVQSTLRQAVAHNQQFMSPGANFMLLNGLAVDIADFDYFAFLDRLKSELRVQQSLAQLGLAPEDTRSLLQLRVEDRTDSLDEARLDMGLQGPAKKAVVWLNNLEVDDMYTDRYGDRISDILHVFPGRLKPLALNVFNLVFVLDPVDAPALTWATLIQRMWSDAYPFHMGLIIKVPAVLERVKQARANPFAQVKAPAWESMSASEKCGLAFLTMDKAWGPRQAMNFWFTLSRTVQQTGSWGDVDEVMQQAFESAWRRAASEAGRGGHKFNSKAVKKDVGQAWKDVAAGADWSAGAAARLQDIAQLLDSKGMAGSDQPVVWLNGMQVTLSGSDTQQVQQELLYKVMMEQQRVQEAVYYGRISDGDDVLTKLLEGGSITRWNPRLLSTSETKYLPLLGLTHDPEYQAGVPRFVGPLTTHTKPSKGKAKDKEGLVLHAASHLVVTNLDSTQGRHLAAEALRFMLEALPGSEASRVLLLLNPGPPAAELGSAPPTLLEAALHVALSQLPQIAGNIPKAPTSSAHTVARFLNSLLGDAALATRLAGPLQENSVTEVEVLLAYAKKAGINADAVKRGLLAVLDAQPHPTTGKPTYKPPASMVKLRESHARLAREVLGLPAGSSAVVTNGRLAVQYATGDDANNLDFTADDFSLLTTLHTQYLPAASMATLISQAHQEGRLSAVAAAPAGSKQQAADNELLAARLDDMVAAAAAAVGLTGKVQERHMSVQLSQVLGYLKGRTVEVTPPQGVEPSGLHIVCILNPLTRPAQRISQVLSMLRGSLVAPAISLVLNPQRDLSDLPLKSFYRYAVPDLAPGSQSLEVAPGSPRAYFSRLPRKRVLTLNMDVPEAWLVEAVQAEHDLDNLRLADIPEPVAHAELELRALMLTGSCIDVTGERGTPPRGLQLHLGTPRHPHHVDTLVMSNLAYFQLKAAPGRWQLSLAPGRTQELYHMVSSSTAPPHSQVALADTLHPSDSPTATQVLVNSLAGKHIILRVRKQPGKEREDVLKEAGEVAPSEEEEEDEEELYHNPYKSHDGDDEYEDDDHPTTPSPTKTPSAAAKKLGGDTINIFTVASGHMYERLQKIMMLSVLNHTRSPVKFWFISNYMSPHHKQVIPRMAKKFGFEYAFVTYKWPHWLHKQTDKQRTIWAYKILFLDVLFPLDVERIIFVDSDQVVRTDLADLYHMDIQGKPYAYTPFCDNNKEMDEFRFWKGGFWNNHLQGKPYHISALYLVDLKKFRAMAAGDNLRVVYEQLSKDPNSLANLDQDLPNYTQHQIHIYSLPQEWLWCESWCGNTTKHLAKTIDLCNNPRTKEPKLSAARRIIAEWPEYDRMQAEITEQIDAELGFGTLTSAQEPNLGAGPEGTALQPGSQASKASGEEQAPGEAPRVAISKGSSHDHSEL